MKYINLFDTQAAYDAAQKYYPNVSYIEATDEVVYQETDPDYYLKQYLTVEMIKSGTIQFSFPPNQSWVSSMSYSLDGGETWVTKQYGEGALITPTIAAGDKVLFKGIATQVSYPNSQASRFNISANCNVSGNIMSLLHGDNFENQTSFPSGSAYNFAYLFAENFGIETNIVSAENLILPATELTNSCYLGMFKSKSSRLTKAPTLPATTLASSCYYNMFYGCTSLTTAPELPATTLANDCYYQMFNGCTNLNNIKMLATNISATNCLNNWVQGVAATGTFTKAASMTTLPTGSSGIPSGWTVQNA